jgi:apolipoprotein N-acyltransferase
MTTQLMSPQAATNTKPATKREAATRRPADCDRGGASVRGRRGSEPSVQEIIATARRRPNLPPARGAWLLGGLTAAMLWSSFMPLDWGPLAWVALVPLLLLVRIRQRTKWMYVAVAVSGVAWMICSLQWMRLGHATMYPAWFLLGTYCGLYLPLFVGVSRIAVHRFRVPLTLAVPVVWVGLEFLRAHLMTGFAWYFLSHTQYRWLELIQISDLVGAYGVSFVVAMTAACLAGLVPESVLRRLKLVDPASAKPQAANANGRKQWIAVAASLVVFFAALGYGYFRRSQAEFTPGPRVALIQGNFISDVKSDQSMAAQIFVKHRQMTGLAVQHQPDVIIWPETMYLDHLVQIADGTRDADIARLGKVNPQLVRERAKLVRNMLADRSREAGAAMVVGLEASEISRETARHYNSAAFMTPDAGLVNRYDKMHRVPFGEFVPFKEQFPWLIRFTPFTSEFGVSAGKGAAVFEYKGYRGTPVICFEDSVPHLVRDVVNATAKADRRGRPADYLINLTNDGWFHGSAELDQHLITALFRCVECRTPMVRAVNTGISAVINGDGEVVDPDVFLDVDGHRKLTSMRDPDTGRWHKSLNAVVVHDVPLDNRASLYLWWGDWFAGTCLALSVAAVAGGWIFQRRDRHNAGRELFEATLKQPV